MRRRGVTLVECRPWLIRKTDAKERTVVLIWCMAFAPTASPQPTTFTYRSAVPFDGLDPDAMFHNTRWHLQVERATTARTREWTQAFRHEQAAITPGRGAA